MTIELAINEVYFWQYSNTGCFNNMLLDLLGKADKNNREKLRIIYPELYAAWSMWKRAGNNGDELFKEYGLMDEDE